MKKFLLITTIWILGNQTILSQNSYNAIKTSKRGGIMNALVNPADMAGMPQKIDVNFIGVDFQVANNVVNLTSNEAGKSNFTDRFFNSVTAEGLTVKVNVDIMGPSVAMAINKTTTIGLLTRGRVQMAMNNIDVILGKGLVDGKYSNTNSLPYTTPKVNNMSGNVVGWAEIGLSAATQVYDGDGHSIRIGGTLKGLFPGAYANTYLTNFKMTLDTTSNGDVKIYNASGGIGLEYNGSNNPTQDVLSNLIGAPKGFAFDGGVIYTFKEKNATKERLKLGFSLLDLGAINFALNSSNSRQFNINPSAIVNPKNIQGNNLDDIIANIKSSGIANEITTDSNITVNMPMAYNFMADVNVWKGFSLTANLQQRGTDINNPRHIQASNYFTIIPRFETKVIELYTPITIAELYGTTVGAGMKLGPLYIGSSSMITSLFSDANKAIDFHVGFRSGFGTRFPAKEAKAK